MYILKLNRSKVWGGLFVFIFFIVLAFSLGISYTELLDSRISISLLLSDLVISFLRVTIIAVIAWLVGIMGGYLLHYSASLSNLFLPIINFIRHISPFAWLPFAIIWFGLGEGPVTFIMFITLFFPTLIAASGHFSSLPHEYLDEGHVLGASQLQIFLHIELPLTLPSLLNLFRIIWGLGWTVIIAAE
ncbi:MAG: ABC transporter permease subunit, partial [Candidatus Cloacimonadota bacterium]|nr:ABC transporter permease subunit [Candidatus Cloacimonadota bacterium]